MLLCSRKAAVLIHSLPAVAHCSYCSFTSFSAYMTHHFVENSCPLLLDMRLMKTVRLNQGSKVARRKPTSKTLKSSVELRGDCRVRWWFSVGSSPHVPPFTSHILLSSNPLLKKMYNSSFNVLNHFVSTANDTINTATLYKTCTNRYKSSCIFENLQFQIGKL